MTIYKFVVWCGGLLCLSTPLWAEDLTFFAQLDMTTGATNRSWFTAENWFNPDEGGNLVPAGRVPAPNDTAIVTGTADAGMGGIRVQTLVLTNGATITNGTYAIEHLQLLDNCGFSNATVNVLVSVDVNGTNAFLSGTVLRILPSAVATFAPVGPALFASLNLDAGSVFSNAGTTTLSDGSRISATGQPQSSLLNQAGAVLECSGQCLVQGDPASHLILDNSGLIQASDGTLTFGDGIDWRSSAGAGEFRAAAPTALILFVGAFQVPSGVTSALTGPGTNRFMASAAIDGTVQVGRTDPNTQAAYPGNLEVNNSVNGAGNLHILGGSPMSGLVTWNNGTFSLPVITIDVGGQFLLNGGPGTNRQLSGCTLNNSGLCRLRSGDLVINPGASVNNLANATFELDADALFSQTTAVGHGSFNNFGTFRKLSAGPTQFGGGSMGVGPDFNNSGLVDLEAGQLSVLGGTSSGEFHTVAGALLWFWGGTHTLNAGAAFIGDGPVLVAQGPSPATLQVNTAIAAAEVEIRSNATVVGPFAGSTNAMRVGTLVLSDNASISNGTWQVRNLQMLDRSTVSGSSLVVSNSWNLSGTNCVLEGTILNLLPTASATLQREALSLPAELSLTRSSTLINAGQLALINGAQINGGGLPQSKLWIQLGGCLSSTNLGAVHGDAAGHLIIDNSGLVRADAGLLRFDDGVDWRCSAKSGEFRTVAPTAEILFAGSFQVESGATSLFTGLGTNRWAGGSTIDGIAQVGGSDPITHLMNPANLEIAGSVTGAGSLHVLGAAAQNVVLTWADGTLGLSRVNLDPNGIMLLGGPTGTSRQLSACSLYNSGRCTLWSGDLGLAQGASINNLAGGTFDVQTDGILIGASGPGGGMVNNTGNFLKSAGTGICSVSAAFNTSGLLQVNSGTLDFKGSWTQTGGTTAVGAGAELAGSTLVLQGGTLTGNGTIAAPVSNSAFVSPGGAPGVLALASNNDYQQSAAGTLEIEIAGAGTNPAQCDQLVVGGHATLGGEIDLQFIKGFVPQPGDQFRVLTCAALRGGFARISAPPLPQTAWITRYTSTNATLVLARQVPLPRPQISHGTATFSLETTPGVAYVVQRSETLAPGSWEDLTSISGDGSTVMVTDSTSEVRKFYRVVMH